MTKNMHFHKLHIGNSTGDAVYFHKPEEPYGYFSNWYISPVVIEGQKFNCVEQYIMYTKCMVFGDERSAARVMMTDNPERQQDIGKKANGYIEHVWAGMRQIVLLDGLRAKFTQNNDLRKKLLATGDAWLVECARTDKTWACGISLHDDKRKNTAEWKGTNILGFALMQVRKELRETGAEKTVHKVPEHNEEEEQNTLEEVFRNTKHFSYENPVLRAAVRYSSQYQSIVKTAVPIAEDDVQKNRRDVPSEVIISRKRPLEAASAYKGRKVCVLNDAIVVQTSIGIVDHTELKEESLFRCSTLYSCLDSTRTFRFLNTSHIYQRQRIGNNDCVYTPDVVVFKTDTDKPELMSQNDWYKVNVLTCAPPDFRKDPMRIFEAKAVFISRLERILQIAAMNGNDVLILGAYGCGRFRNDPVLAAVAMKEAISSYRYLFDTIEIAVCDKGTGGKQNYQAFLDVFGTNRITRDNNSYTITKAEADFFRKEEASLTPEERYERNKAFFLANNAANAAMSKEIEEAETEKALKKEELPTLGEKIYDDSVGVHGSVRFVPKKQ